MEYIIIFLTKRQPTLNEARLWFKRQLRYIYN